jgi:hypothetical protein
MMNVEEIESINYVKNALEHRRTLTMARVLNHREELIQRLNSPRVVHSAVRKSSPSEEGPKFTCTGCD